MQITEQQLQQIKELIGIDPTRSPDTPQDRLQGRTLRQIATELQKLFTPKETIQCIPYEQPPKPKTKKHKPQTKHT